MYIDLAQPNPAHDFHKPLMGPLLEVESFSFFFFEMELFSLSFINKDTPLTAFSRAAYYINETNEPSFVHRR